MYWENQFCRLESMHCLTLHCTHFYSKRFVQSKTQCMVEKLGIQTKESPNPGLQGPMQRFQQLGGTQLAQFLCSAFSRPDVQF